VCVCVRACVRACVRVCVGRGWLLTLAGVLRLHPSVDERAAAAAGSVQATQELPRGGVELHEASVLPRAPRRGKRRQQILVRSSERSLFSCRLYRGWLGSRVVSVLDSGTVGPGFKSQPRCCRVTVLGKLFTPVVPLFTKKRNW